MSSKIDIITEGYAYMTVDSPVDKQYMKATGSCCLVRSGGLKILFDTMGPWEKDMLLQKIGSLKIHPDDIDILVCSHSHPDHVGNLNLFTKARKHFVGISVYTADLYDLNLFEVCGSYKYTTKHNTEVEVVRYDNYKIDQNTYVEPTQGHTAECVSLFVKNCDIYGTVGLVGDLFERQEDVTDESIWLAAGSQNMDLQRANRARVYNEVDYILPGHGPLFKADQIKPIKF